MKKTKIVYSIIGLCMFVPIDVLAYQNDVKINSLKSYTYKESTGNFLKFKMINGKLHINDEYTHLLQTEMQELYYKALESTPTTLTLAKELAKLSKKDPSIPTQNEGSLYRYLHRFNFAQVEKAATIKTLMQRFIKQNNLFEMSA